MLRKSLLITFATVAFCFSNRIQAQETNSSLNTFIEKKKNYNKNSKNGVSVLLYNGSEEKAREIYNEFKTEFKDIDINLRYVSPDWKVLTNAYSSSLEAERIAIIIRQKYPSVKIL
ncbi:hypothetical protein [Wenyingzhuangia aestuarii]|uniref:hypothetical protein n=1 Tax=Wenyingzhuangia aestuarii TaxID=1647582 RepID=UPI001439BD64|nr:hypothetical protein [Wenyingzhuangia aestuarii]NJB83895.1 hypothetical protein [Wenyingzhuangia aestuarii]